MSGRVSQSETKVFRQVFGSGGSTSQVAMTHAWPMGGAPLFPTNLPMKPKFNPRRLLVSSLIILTASHAKAVDYYWDANGATGGTGGSGNWTTTTSLWRNGSATGTLAPWVNGNMAFLGGTYGTVTTTAAIEANQINVVAGTAGTAPFTVSNGTGGSLTITGPNKAVNVASGTSLLINPRTLQTTVTGETSMLTVQGGGTLTMSGINRCYGGNMTVTGAGTRLIFSGGNGLNLGTAANGMPAGSVGVIASSGGTVEIRATSNYTAAVQLSGGKLELSLASTAASFPNGLALQSGGGITALGTAKSSVVGTAGTGNTAFITANAGTRIITVNSTGDPSGYDLELSASSGSLALIGNTSNIGNFQKNGAGVMRLLPGVYISNMRDRSYVSSKTSLIVNAGTFQNEADVHSITEVNNGAIAKTGSASGTYDAVLLHSGGTFELSRASGTFTSGIAFGSGENSITFNGGSLKFSGINTDVSSSISTLAAKAVIDTNTQNVTFATGLTGTGSLEKRGAGTLTLAAANTFSGDTVVTSGTLAIGSTGSVGSAVVDVRNNAVLDVTALAGAPLLTASGSVLTGTGTSLVTGDLNLPAGTILRPGGFNLAGTTAITGNFNLAGNYQPDLAASSDLVTVSGAANLAGAKILPISSGPFPAGTYTVLTYGTLTGDPVLDPSFASSRYNPVLSLGPKTSPGSISISLAGNLADLIWSGKNTAIWASNSDQNWTNLGVDDVFRQLDTVTFDDTALANLNISIPSEVSPTGLNFYNMTHAYQFTGAGSITGTTGLNKVGEGTVILGTNNTFSGSIYNEAGVLQIGNGGTTGTVGTGVITNNGQLIFNRSNDLTATNVISGSGSLQKLGAGKLTLTGTNTYSGATAINGGTLSLAADNQLGTAPVGQTLTLNGALEITATATIAANRSLILGPLDADGTGTIDVNTNAAGIVTYNGVISNNGTGTAGLTKKGLGVLALGGANTYSGVTTVQAGSVRTTTPSAFGAATAGTVIESGAGIYILGGSQASPILEPFTISGNGDGTGAIRAGTGNARYTIAGPVGLAANAGIYVDANTAMDFTNTISGTNTDLSFQNGSLDCTLSGDISLGTGSFTKTGAGVTILTGSNSYGSTTISAATLQVGDGGTTGSLGNGSITNNGTLILRRSNSLTVASSITGTGTLTKSGAGTTTLSGANSYTGTTSITAGTLQIDGIHTAGAGYSVSAGATLGGNGSTTSGVTVNGSISPGASIGTLSTGPVVLNNGSSLAMEINTSTLTADKLVVTGDVTRPGATVNLVLTDLASPATTAALPNGTQFALVEYTGAWDPTKTLTYNGVAVPDNSTITFGPNVFTVKYNDSNRLTLTALQTSTAFETWISTYSATLDTSAKRLPGADPDGDGVTNFLEFALKGNPTSSANTGLVAVITQDTDAPADTKELTLVAAVRRGITFASGAGNSQQGSKDGVTYNVQGSLALTTWDSAVSAISTGENTVPGSILTEDLTGTDWQYRTFVLDASEGLVAKGFLRIKVSE